MSDSHFIDNPFQNEKLPLKVQSEIVEMAEMVRPGLESPRSSEDGWSAGGMVEERDIEEGIEKQEEGAQVWFVVANEGNDNMEKNDDENENETENGTSLRETIIEKSMIYEGYVKNEGVYEGKGKLLFKNGDSYEGIWREGLMEGKGSMR